ncbi:MAG: hypothetical protein LBP79_01455 [Clostridiales bacterium]|jgi:hypothetical protein|nr:hypothetical protein [Clostridiales bacterium]
MKNKGVKILALCILFAAAFTALTSCDADNIKGSYSLAAASDSSGKESLAVYEYYKLEMSAKGTNRRYKITYKTKTGNSVNIEGYWDYQKKELSFFKTAADNDADREAWNKKDKTITLTRHKNGGAVVVYTFKKN